MPRRNLPARHGGARTAGAAPRSRQAGAAQGPGELRAGEQVQFWREVEYRVRPVSGASSAGASSAGSASSYRCPGCDQLLAAGVAHLVAWPAEDLHASDRRHWHRACWQARERRSPGVQRSRNAPRYG